MQARENEENKKKLERHHSRIHFGKREREHYNMGEKKRTWTQERKARSARGIHVTTKRKVWTATNKGRK